MPDNKNIIKKIMLQKILFNIKLNNKKTTFKLPIYTISVLALLFIFYTFYIGFSQKKLVHADAIKIENQQLKQELEKITNIIDSLNYKAQKIEARHDSIIIKRNIPTVPSELKNLYELDDIKVDDAYSKLAVLKTTLQKAKIRIDNAYKTDNEILAFLKSQEDVYKNTPSIFPTFGRITAPYGWRRDPFTRRKSFHHGIDIANKRNTPIYATADGTVSFTGRNGSYGKTIDIKHKYGYKTRYGHLKKILVRKYEKVKKGQIIALMGNSGKSTGPHVHYEVKRFNKRKNPWYFLHKTYDEIAMDRISNPVHVAGR